MRVNTMPVTPTCSWKAVAVFTASWPVIASATSSDSTGFNQVAQRGRLFHHLTVDREPPGGIEEHDVVTLARGDAHGAPGDGRRPFAEYDGQGVDPRLLAKQFELLLGRGAVHIHRRHEHLLAVAVAQAAGELGGRRCLARALQAQHEHGKRRVTAELEVLDLTAQHLDHPVVDDLYDLLAGRDRAQHVVSDGLFLDRVEQRAHRRQRRIGFQQGHAHLAQRRLHVARGERSPPGEAPENVAEPLRQSFEHACRFLPPVTTPNAPMREHSRTGGPPRRQSV